jgi:hypothetical protein
MGFEKELSELINKLPNAKARIIYLEKLLKKEKNKDKRKIIKKILSNAQKELKTEEKNIEKKKKEVKLEEIIKPSIMPTITGPAAQVEEEYVRPITHTEPIAIREGLTEAAPKGEETYEVKPEYKAGGLEGESSYTPKTESEYMGKLEGEMLFKAREESTPTSPTESLEDYTAAKDSEEYKRNEQFKDILRETSKKEEEEEEYKRKKLKGLI